MSPEINLHDITIRTTLQPGDLGYVAYRHGKLYHQEYGYGITFEMYVAAGLAEFYKNFDPALDRTWICEHNSSIVGFILLMHRENKTAQLRYFYLEPGYRSIGLGKKLMSLYMNFLYALDYTCSCLWTTNELTAAASLYTRFGFVLAEEKDSAAFGKPLKEQKYVLTITADKQRGKILPVT